MPFDHARRIMGEFFNGWRRKAGCFLLVMAALLTGAWIRSFVVQDTVLIRNYCVGSDRGWIWWLEMPDMDQWKWGSQTIDSDWNDETGINWHFGIRYCAIRYWSIAVPLSLLSGFLILRPVKRKPAKPTQNSTAPTSDLQS